MTQLWLRFDTLRLEIPLYEMSWWEYGIVQRRRVYAHCVSHQWPWFQFGMGWR